MGASEPLKNQRDGKKPAALRQAIEVSQTQARLAMLGAGIVLFALAVLPAGTEQPLFIGEDKLKHVGAFGVLAFLARLSWPRLPYWSLALGLTGFGVMIELVQGVSGWGRTASVADVIADLVGLALGCAAYEALRNWRRP